jgi:Zn ribbon nucleic-acid-binding protein
MTKGEAITRLKQLLTEYENTLWGDLFPRLRNDDEKMLELAIAALEEQDEWVEHPVCPKCGGASVLPIMGYEDGWPLVECMECHWAFGIHPRFLVKKEG